MTNPGQATAELERMRRFEEIVRARLEQKRKRDQTMAGRVAFRLDVPIVDNPSEGALP